MPLFLVAATMTVSDIVARQKGDDINLDLTFDLEHNADPRRHSLILAIA